MQDICSICRKSVGTLLYPSEIRRTFPTDFRRIEHIPCLVTWTFTFLYIFWQISDRIVFFVGNLSENFTYPRKRTAKNIRAPTKADSDGIPMTLVPLVLLNIKRFSFLLPHLSSLSLKSLRFSPQISLSLRRFLTKISQISSTIM